MRPLVPVVVCLLVLALPSPAWSQNRAETQMLLELRTLQEQIQRLLLVLNQLTDRVKTAEGKIEAQAGDTRTGFANQKGLIDAIGQEVRTLKERESEGSVRVAQLSQEMKAIRDGLTVQQTLLNQIVQLLQPIAAGVAPPDTTDPAAAGAAGGQPALKPPPAIPPSPSEYYKTAFGYYYSGQYELAVDALGEAIKRFPEATEAARAQLTIGDAYTQMGKRFEEALTAYTAVIATYRDPEVVPDAYYKQGLTYEALGRVPDAVKSYQQVVALYKDSAAATLATQALRRLIKK